MASSQTDRLYALLSQRIRTAEIKPGELLAEPEIAAEYGVSRTPARETLRLLAAEGWLQVLPRKGYLVRPLQIQDVSEVMGLRIMIEPTLAGLAAEEPSSETLDELRTLVDEQHAPASDRDVQLGRAEDFHLLIANTSGNARAATVLAPLVAEISRLHHAMPRVAEHISSEAEHQAHLDIIDAISNRDAEQAERTMREHLEESRDAMFQGF